MRVTIIIDCGESGGKPAVDFSVTGSNEPREQSVADFNQKSTEQTRLKAGNAKDSEGNPASLDPSNPLRAEVLSGPGSVVTNPATPTAPDEVVVIAGAANGEETKFRLIADGDPGPGVAEVDEEVTVAVSDEPAAPVAVGFGVSAVNEQREA